MEQQQQKITVAGTTSTGETATGAVRLGTGGPVVGTTGEITEAEIVVITAATECVKEKNSQNSSSGNNNNIRSMQQL